MRRLWSCGMLVGYLVINGLTQLLGVADPMLTRVGFFIVQVHKKFIEQFSQQ
jgi:hypothetical protein